METDFPADLHIAGEKRYTSIILQNLLENARKYNRPGGRIRIQLRRFAEKGLAQAGEIAARAGLPRGAHAVPVQEEGPLWVHDGRIVDRFVVDRRWGLCWSKNGAI